MANTAGKGRLALCPALAERGARLIAVDRAAPELADAAAALPSSAQALAVTADVTQEDEVAGYVGAALSAIVDGRHPGAAPMSAEERVERIPARRLGQASQVAAIVAFLGLRRGQLCVGRGLHGRRRPDRQLKGRHPPA